ncbi:MAG: hypothetical protein C4576_09580 [Desulfobacteraceae bacterium]|nr:MAG: hypothetical protein C4576_09580 [Desulfobacteraceae bacterium]
MGYQAYFRRSKVAKGTVRLSRWSPGRDRRTRVFVMQQKKAACSLEHAALIGPSERLLPSNS